MVLRGIRWSGAGISNGRQRLASSQVQIRSYSKTLKRAQPLQPSPSQKLHPRQYVPIQCRSLSLFGWTLPSQPSSDEFATAHSAPSATPPSQNVNEPINITIDPPSELPRTVKASHATSDAPDPSLPVQSSPPYTAEPGAIHDLENRIAMPASTEPGVGVTGGEDIQAIPETIGYLKETCGLDYGWGFTTTIEYVLEHLHITAGLSWGASMVAVAVLIRLIVFRPLLKSSDQSARMREINPQLKPLRALQQKALENRDRTELLAIRERQQRLFQENDIKMRRIFLPLLLQIPLQFGAFRLLRAMAAVPVPAFATESWLWTTNLALSDPYYILPVISTLSVYGAIKIGSPESTADDLMTNEVKNILKTALPALNFAFMCFQPGSVQLYLTTTTLLAVGQAYLMTNPRTRNWLGLYPFPAPASTPATMTTTATSPVKTEVPQAPRSAIDKGVDWVKARLSKRKAGFKSIGDYMFGSVESRQRKETRESLARYEAKRRKELEAERESRNLQEKRITPQGPNVVRMPTKAELSKLPEDNFRDDDDELSRQTRLKAKKSTPSKKIKR